MTETQQLKSTLRKSVRAKRNSLSRNQIQQAELDIAETLVKSKVLENRKRIACFLSFDGEISTQSVIQTILNNGYSCYLPKLRPYKPNRLWFLPYQSDSKMENNRFGIPEVAELPNNALAVSSLDLVLMPLVAFDKTGNRLGMGGGFYDATFAHLKKSNRRPLFIGLAYEQQRMNDLPSDPWDLPLDGVITEQRFYRF